MIFIESNDVTTLIKTIEKIRQINIWVFIGIIDATIWGDLHGKMLQLLRTGASLVFDSISNAQIFHSTMIGK